MTTWLIRAAGILLAAAAALALLAMFGTAWSDPVGLRIVADCWPAETGFEHLTAEGLLLRDAWQDEFGQLRERWVSPDGGAWAEVMIAHGPSGDGRCVVAQSAPGDPA